MSELSSERKRMCSGADLADVRRSEAREILRQIAAQCAHGFSVKAALDYAARRMLKFGWSRNRCRDVWNADHRIRVTSDELNELRVAAKLVQEEKAADDELAQLRKRVARLEALLVAKVKGLDHP